MTCSSYNDTCDVLPSIRNLLYYFIGFICRSIYVQLPSTCLCQVLLAQVCNFMSICTFSFSIYICISSFHIIEDKMAVCPPFYFWTSVYISIHVKFYRATSLCMLDSWCIIHAQFYLWLLYVFLYFVYGLLFPKDKMISFLLIPCIVSVLVFEYHAPNLCFSRYLYSIHLYVCYFSEHVCMCVCVRVCILLYKMYVCMCVFIVGQ